MGVRIIPAQMAKPIQVKDNPAVQTKKTRVAAYCRVSTDMEEQESSFESQVNHYTEYINANPNWELAGIYADEGISGTGTKKRERFNAMIKDCEDGKIDMVITKSISRFARNTLDCLQYIRKLKALNIPILFEKENINTMDSSGEMLITIMASIAQQESQSISQNIRMGHQYRMQQGKPLTRGGFMGYRMSKDKNYLEIIPEEAVIVRRMYREFLEGETAQEIAKDFTAEGIKSPEGEDHWVSTTVGSMLRNEKYRGDLLLQKYYVKDFLTKERVKNNGKFPKYYVENAHEPIVPREVSLRVQGEILRRNKIKESTGKNTRKQKINFKDKIVCSKCGGQYSRFLDTKRGMIYWICRKHHFNKNNCDSRNVKESILIEATLQAFHDVIDYLPQLEEMKKQNENGTEVLVIQKKIDAIQAKEDKIREQISQYAESGKLNTEDSSDSAILQELEEKKAKLKELQDQKDALMCEKADYDFQAVQVDCLIDLIHEMQEDPSQPKEEVTEDIDPDIDLSRFGSYAPVVREQLAKYPASCSDVADFFERTADRKHHGPITTFDNNDVIRYIDRIVVYDDYLDVIFKAGVKIKIDL